MLDVFFVVGILFVGAITSYTDLKYGKIRNKILLLGIIYVLLLNIAVFFSIESVNPKGYVHYLTNSAFMLFLGYVLWNVGLWTAGDAKLFFVLNLLTPPFLITEYYIDYFYGIVYFINIFGVLFLYLLYKTIRKVKKKEVISSLKKTFRPKQILMVLVFFFSIGFFFPFLPDFLVNNYFIAVFMVFILFSLFESFFGKKLLVPMLLIAALRVILQYEQMLSPGFWAVFLSQALFILVLRFVLLRLSYLAFTTRFPISQLKMGMFLAEDIVPVTYVEKNKDTRRKMGLEDSQMKYAKTRIENLTFIAYLKSDNFRHIDYDKNKGLTSDLISWFVENRKDMLFKSLRTYDTMPFAPLIFIGVLVTLLIKGNIFTFLRDIVMSIL